MPELFNPKHVVTLNGNRVNRRLEKVFPKLPKWQGYGESWFRNSHNLLAWGGDVRNMYQGVETEAEIRARIVNKGNYSLPLKERGLYMFKEKMCALLTYFLMCAGHIRPIRMSPPIDFHHMRAMLGSGMIRATKKVYHPSKVARTGDRLGREYLYEYPEMPPVKFADLLFVLSREACAKAVSDPNADWGNPGVTRQYMQSCGQCPIENLCDHLVVTSEYYRKGDRRGSRTITIVPRPKPPHGYTGLIT